MEKLLANEPFFLSGGTIGCVVVHGFSGSPSEIIGLGQFLHQKGYTVGGVLLKGHGTSPEDMAKTRWTDWYVSVTEVVQRLRQNCYQVWAVGLSLGGALSLYAASEGLVDGVVALAAPTGLADWRARFTGLAKYFMPYQHKKITPEQQEFNRKMGRVVYDRIPLAAVESLYSFVGIVRKALPLVTVPGLIIHTEKDEVIAPESGVYIYNNIASVNKELLLLKKSGHIVTEDVEQDVVLQAVADFLQKYASLKE